LTVLPKISILRRKVASAARAQFRDINSRPEKIGEADVRVWADRKMELVFTEPRAAGERVYELIVTPKDFTELTQAMMYADSEQAIKAFGAALQLGHISPPSVDPHEAAWKLVFPPKAHF
jgi:hypothetical protein